MSEYIDPSTLLELKKTFEIPLHYTAIETIPGLTFAYVRKEIKKEINKEWVKFFDVLVLASDTDPEKNRFRTVVRCRSETPLKGSVMSDAERASVYPEVSTMSVGDSYIQLDVSDFDLSGILSCMKPADCFGLRFRERRVIRKLARSPDYVYHIEFQYYERSLTVAETTSLMLKAEKKSGKGRDQFIDDLDKLYWRRLLDVDVFKAYLPVDSRWRSEDRGVVQFGQNPRFD